MMANRFLAFTDGSCTQNGKPGARAAFAALIIGGQFGGGQWLAPGAAAAAGMLRDATLITGAVLAREYAIDGDGNIIQPPGAPPVAPSNNRGELLGIIYALAALTRGGAEVDGRSDIEIVSDSDICIRTLDEWLPARLKKKTEHALKNLDLVMIAWRLLVALRSRARSVTLTHTRSHQKPPPPSAPYRDRLIHRGNAIVDECAGEVLADADSAITLPRVVNGPDSLRGLAVAVESG